MTQFLRKFKILNLDNSKKNRTFASNDEPTALATDVGKPTPILKGKDAERFVRNMVEIENRAPQPKTKEDIEKELSYMKIMYEFEKNQLEELEEKIKDLENKLNGKAKEE